MKTNVLGACLLWLGTLMVEAKLPFCKGTRNPVLVSRKNLYCIRKQVTRKYDRMEKEYATEKVARIKRCFEDVGKKKCGSYKDIKKENVFDAEKSKQRQSCTACNQAFLFLESNYFVSNEKRGCFNQFFLDTVSTRAKQCTKRKTPLIDTDFAAFDHMDDLRKSIALSMSWRHSLDTCEDADAKEDIAQCMREEPSLRRYCSIHKICYLRRFKRCKSSTYKSAGSKSLAAKKKMCGCFNGQRPKLMESLKTVADEVSDNSKIDGYDGSRCSSDARKLLKPMGKTNPKNWAVDWLDVIGPAFEKCANIPAAGPQMILIDMPCGSIEEGPTANGLTSIQQSLYFISNFASALMDRMVRFCRCR